MSFLCELAAPSVKRTAVAAAKAAKVYQLQAGKAAKPGRLYVKHICFVYRLHTFDRYCQLRNNMSKLRSSVEALMARKTSRGRGISLSWFIEANTAFHVGIARLTRNQMLIQAVSETRNQMERIMYAAIDIHCHGELPGRERREILQAIQERDPERA
jgi:DNA-binding FadR family transcriptional regulator